jgi:hypothetical protein
VTRVWSLVLVLAGSGCGTNRPEIPPELLATGGTSVRVGCDSLDYPEGPYGTLDGSVAVNSCFQGWGAPSSTPHTEAALEDISLGAFHDPSGKHYKLLLVNSAALWCAVCKTEHQSLPQHYAELAPRGLAILSALFQNNAGQAATLGDLKLWVETYHPPFPMVLDPDYQLGDYAPAASAPLNLLIDASTMQIIETFIGNQGSVLWPRIEDELRQREAAE